VPIYASAYKQTALEKYQAVLDPGKPLATWPRAKRDQAWVKICEEIKKAVNEQVQPPPSQEHLDALDGGDQKIQSNNHGAALAWEHHLGHQYQAVGNAIYTIGVQFFGKNISDNPVQLEAATITSAITEEKKVRVRFAGASADVVVETVGGCQTQSYLRIGQRYLRMTQNPP
jgi:hypothetical protein